MRLAPLPRAFEILDVPPAFSSSNYTILVQAALPGVGRGQWRIWVL